MNLRSRAAPRMLAIQSRNVAGTFLAQQTRSVEPSTPVQGWTCTLETLRRRFSPLLACMLLVCSALHRLLGLALKGARRVQRRRHGSIEKRSNATERLPMAFHRTSAHFQLPKPGALLAAVLVLVGSPFS